MRRLLNWLYRLFSAAPAPPSARPWPTSTTLNEGDYRPPGPSSWQVALTEKGTPCWAWIVEGVEPEILMVEEGGRVIAHVMIDRRCVHCVTPPHPAGQGPAVDDRSRDAVALIAIGYALGLDRAMSAAIHAARSKRRARRAPPLDN